VALVSKILKCCQRAEINKNDDLSRCLTYLDITNNVCRFQTRDAIEPRNGQTRAKNPFKKTQPNAPSLRMAVFVRILSVTGISLLLLIA